MYKIVAAVTVVGLAACVAVWSYFRWQELRPPMRQVPLTIETVNGPVRFNVEMATTEAEQKRGLMYRTSLARDAGMLFDFHSEKRLSFWMKNTLIPLDMVFIKTDGTIVWIAARARPLSLTPVGSPEPARAVLEIRGGRAAELELKRGDHVVNSIFGDAPQ